MTQKPKKSETNLDQVSLHSQMENAVPNARAMTTDDHSSFGSGRSPSVTNAFVNPSFETEVAERPERNAMGQAVPLTHVDTPQYDWTPHNTVPQTQSHQIEMEEYPRAQMPSVSPRRISPHDGYVNDRKMPPPPRARRMSPPDDLQRRYSTRERSPPNQDSRQSREIRRVQSSRKRRPSPSRQQMSNLEDGSPSWKQRSRPNSSQWRPKPPPKPSHVNDLPPPSWGQPSRGDRPEHQ